MVWRANVVLEHLKLVNCLSLLKNEYDLLADSFDRGVHISFLCTRYALCARLVLLDPY